MTKVTPDQLRAAAEEGLLPSEVAERFGIVRSYVSILAKRYALKFARRRPKHLDGLLAAAAEGLSQSQAAQRLRIHPANVSVAARKFGIKFVLGYQMNAAPDDRAKMMAAMYRQGYTLQDIGTQYSLTRERVRQIITKHFGIRAKDGGRSVNSSRTKDQMAAARDDRAMQRRGCTWDQYLALRRMKKPTRDYSSQRSNANKRGIGWELNLWQWWTIWQQSGHWPQRGRGQGYVMCRKGDEGPYAVGNVFIALATENCSDRKGHKSGLPTGVYLKSGGYAAKRRLEGKDYHLGTFKTPELAHAAYLAAPQLVARAA